MKQVEAVVVYIELEGGFWALEATDGKQFKPVYFPEQLKIEGQKIRAYIREVDMMGMSMWGMPVKIMGFSIL